jgi:D-alanyl-D-alanine carboxypeptidase/D-alanyl-D-alanine-endopeptidase (penicillin-binding protein 4)
MTDWAAARFRWKHYRIVDGAGLSPNNRLSARQLLEVVQAFAPYRELLPRPGAGVQAKTGTLTGVSCLAGFVQREGRWDAFSLMINDPVPFGFRIEVAEALARLPAAPATLSFNRTTHP